MKVKIAKHKDELTSRLDYEPIETISKNYKNIIPQIDDQIDTNSERLLVKRRVFDDDNDEIILHCYPIRKI